MKGRGRDLGLMYLLLTLALVILLGFLFWKPKETQNENPIEKEIVENIEEVKDESVSNNNLESDSVEYIENDDPADLKEDNYGAVLYDLTLVQNDKNDIEFENEYEEKVHHLENKILEYVMMNTSKFIPRFKEDHIYYFENRVNNLYRVARNTFENKKDYDNYFFIEISINDSELEKNNIVAYLKFTDKDDLYYYVISPKLIEKSNENNLKEYFIEKTKIDYNEIPTKGLNFIDTVNPFSDDSYYIENKIMNNDNYKNLYIEGVNHLPTVNDYLRFFNYVE